MPRIKDRVGKKVINNQGIEVEIIEYFGSYNSTVQFNDSCKSIRYNIEYCVFKNKQVKSLFHPNVCNIGFLGDGKYKSKDEYGNPTKSHSTWSNMIRRCYSENNQKRNPTYVGCTVDEEWHNYQNFAKWYEENYIEGWQIDKDFITPLSKTYSSENCCFLPREINALISIKSKSKSKYSRGVSYAYEKYYTSFCIKNKRNYIGCFLTEYEASNAYLKAKKERLNEMIDKYRDYFSEEVYNNLINFDINLVK